MEQKSRIFENYPCLYNESQLRFSKTAKASLPGESKI